MFWRDQLVTTDSSSTLATERHRRCCPLTLLTLSREPFEACSGILGCVFAPFAGASAYAAPRMQLVVCVGLTPFSDGSEVPKELADCCYCFLCLCLSVCLSLSVFVSVCLSVSVSPSLSLSLCLYLSVSPSLSLSLCLYLSVCVRLSVCLSVSLFLTRARLLFQSLCVAWVGFVSPSFAANSLPLALLYWR